MIGNKSKKSPFGDQFASRTRLKLSLQALLHM